MSSAYKHLLLPILVCLVSLQPRAAEAPGRLIHYQGKDYFLNGINIAWNQFGTDFGMHPEWGGLYDPQWFEQLFGRLEEAGANCIRIWVHCDGRSSPEFDENGFVTGMDFNFLSDMGDLLDRAAAHDILVMPVLWSFDMVVKHEGAGPFGGNHADLLLDDARQDSYLENFLVPFCEFVSDKPAVVAIETMNEPEWMIDFITTEAKRVPLPRRAVERFNGRMASVIHRHAKKMATVGVSAVFSSPVMPRKETDQVYNLFNTDSLRAACDGDTLAFFDFYQLHWYPWQNDDYWGLDLVAETPASLAIDDKPVIVGEVPCDLGPDFIETLYKQGYAGNFYWSVTENDTARHGVWHRDALPVMAAFSKEHPELTDWEHEPGSTGASQSPVVTLGSFETRGSTDGWMPDRGIGNGKTITAMEWSNTWRKSGTGSLRISFEGLSSRQVDGDWPHVAGIQAGGLPPAAKDLTRFRYLCFSLYLAEPVEGSVVQVRPFVKTGKQWEWCAPNHFVDIKPGRNTVLLDLWDLGGELSSVKTIGLQFQAFGQDFTGDIWVDAIRAERQATGDNQARPPWLEKRGGMSNHTKL